MEAGLIVAAALACPIVMGAMMWFMAKGMGGGKEDDRNREQLSESSLAEVKAEQVRLGAEIDRLEAEEDSREQVASGSGERA